MHEPVKKYQLKEGQLKHLMGDLGRLASTLTTETKIYEQAQPGDRSLVNLTSERRAPDLVLFNFKSPNFMRILTTQAGETLLQHLGTTSSEICFRFSSSG